MRRTLLLTASATAVAAAVLPGYAAPVPANTGRVAATHLTFRLTEGRTLSLELRAATLSDATVLRVLAHHCDASGACAESVYQSPLSPASLTIDPMTADAELRTTIGGRQLHIQWRPDGTSGVVVGSPEAQGTGTSGDGSAFVGDPAVASVQLDGRSCSGAGSVGTAVFAGTGEVTGSPGDAGLADLHLPATAPLTCS